MPSDFSESIDSRHAFTKADNEDCEVLVATDRTLQLDLDSDSAYELFQSQLSRLNHVIDYGEIEELSSKNGNRHVIIHLNKKLAVRDRILLQACLGSDPVREILSYRRVLQGDDNPVLLLRPKPKKLSAGKKPKALLSAPTQAMQNILEEMVENE
jgi:hypothetical protein